jgi:hypothetical protein
MAATLCMAQEIELHASDMSKCGPDLACNHPPDSGRQDSHGAYLCVGNDLLVLLRYLGLREHLAQYWTRGLSATQVSPVFASRCALQLSQLSAHP